MEFLYRARRKKKSPSEGWHPIHTQGILIASFLDMWNKKTEMKTKRYVIPYNTKNIHNLQNKALNITRKARDEIDRRDFGGIKVSFLGAFMIQKKIG